MLITIAKSIRRYESVKQDEFKNSTLGKHRTSSSYTDHVGSSVHVGSPMLNLVYEMGARTLVMVIASVYVMMTQDPKQFLVVLLMNIVREGQEMIIDPMYPVLNAPASPTADFWIHVVIVAIEILAFIAVYRISKK